MRMQTELIRKTFGKRREEKTVFEEGIWLNEQLERLGIKLTDDDYLVRKVFGPQRKS